MEDLSYLKDKDFLRELDNVNNKFFWVKIEILNMDELPIESIEGRVQPGSTISVDGNSSVRRTCNISFVAEDTENDLTNVDNLLSINKRIKILVGIENHINQNYDPIIWFPQGIFVIIQPNISHSSSGCIINLSCKDKMCLLNGECGGGLPTSVTFHEYDQMIGLRECGSDPRINEEYPNNYTIYEYNGNYYSWTSEYGWKQEANKSRVGEVVSIPQKFYDIIQTLVCNFGGEALSKIFINDIPLDIKQVVRYTGSNPLYYNTKTSQYTTNDSIVEGGDWKVFNYNEDVGYIYTDFTYPGQLVSGIGENVCSVLDKIKNTLGNYEYFYDVNGNFVFQEIKNYLNTSYDPTDSFRLDNNRKIEVKKENGLCIIDETNYEVDFNSNTRSVYTFEEGNGLVTAFTNAPVYTNLKNDYHIWGKASDGFAIHYHIAIKEKPKVMNEYKVVNLTDKNGEFNGRIRLANNEDEDAYFYTPEDWRAELYLQGLQKQQLQQRPDIYEQELLDLFDSIYDFRLKKFKSDEVNNPNDLKYFFDYLEPISHLYDCSVDLLNPKVYSYQQDKIRKLYNVDIPNVILIDLDMDINTRSKIIARCVNEGQPYANIDHKIYSNVAIGTMGYTAQEVARDLLYQYTNYNESISIQSIPIYYLNPNTRISVYDQNSGIYGDYIIKSYSLPIDARNTMSINAVKVLERI